MASAPAKNTNKDRTTPRLGRGLSSLIGGPVSVEPPALDAQATVKQAVAPDVSRDQLDLVNPRKPAASAPHPLPRGPGERGGERSESPAEGGRAIDAAPPEPDSQTSGGRRLLYIPLDSIEPSPFQPRSVATESGLVELASSISESGVMQPIVVRPRSDAQSTSTSAIEYELIAGERRWRASKLAGLRVIPAVVVEIDDRTAAEWALVENIQREDLNAVDRARAFRALAERFGMTHGQVAQRVGLDRATVANTIRLTELEPQILDMLARDEITAGHARALLSAAPGASRIDLAQRAASASAAGGGGGGWSVRALEEHIRAASSAARDTNAAPASNASTKERSAQIVALEKQLAEHLSTKVRIKARPGASKGRIEIEFYDLDHFDSLMDRIGFSPE